MKQQEWVLTRKKLLRKIKAQVFARLGRPPASLRQYAKRLDGEFRGRWRACTWEELLKSVAESHVAFGSDFHAHSQSQRAHVRILRSLPPQKKVVLALECLCSEDQAATDRFMNGEMSEEDFLQEIDWTNVWGFPWEHYRPFFDLAEKRRFSVRALSARQKSKKDFGLEGRDGQMAETISELQNEHPGALIYVLVGEMHLAHSHLPDAWQSKRPSDQCTIIHQDAESLYFRLAMRARDQAVDVMRSGHRYCLMVSPPWVKWQSYLMFLEQTYDRELDEEGESIDHSDHVQSLVDLLARDFGLQVMTSHLQVYTPADKEALKLLKRSVPRQRWPVLLRHLESNRSFLLPEKGLIYLSSSTLNRAASMAGEFLHAQLSGRSVPLWGGVSQLEALIWVEGFAFFCSKWINPKRKAESDENLNNQISALSPTDRGRGALSLALDQRMSEIVWIKSSRRRRLRSKPKRLFDVLEAARILGTMLGEKLFSAIRSGGVTVSELVDWMQYPVTDPDFDEFYRRLLKRLK